MGFASTLCPTRSRLTMAVVGIMVIVASGCSAGTAPEVTSGDPVLEQGRDVYVRQCASCHGADGGGGRGSKLNEGAVLAAYPEMADQVVLVSEGKNAMPGFGGRLEAADLDAVIRYTREVLTESGGSQG